MSPSKRQREIPLHWLQALRGKSCLFTADEARRILPTGAIPSEGVDSDAKRGRVAPTTGPMTPGVWS